jgi:general secretion pathway protein C
MAAPPCAGITAVIVTESSDPVWSVAALRLEGEATASLKRVGDGLGNRVVTFIGYNSVQASPAVWLVDETSLCQALLFDHDARGDAIPDERESSRPRAAKLHSATVALDSTIADRIQKVSSSEFVVDRSLVDDVVKQQSLLMTEVRVVPEVKNGETLGIRLFVIKPESMLAKLGLQNGDRLDVINGFPLSSPEQALQAYAQLLTADAFALKITRRGKAIDLDYAFR